MDRERWKQVDELLQSALQQPSGERESFLRAACGADETLEQETLSLLASHEQAGSFLENPAIEVAARYAAQDGTQQINDPLTGSTQETQSN